MPKSVKVAISLPASLAQQADALRQARGESRSAFFQRAIEAALREEREHLAVGAYVRGYEREPEDVDEIAAAQSSGVAALATDPFD